MAMNAAANFAMRDCSASILPLMRARGPLRRLSSRSNTPLAFGMTTARHQRLAAPASPSHACRHDRHFHSRVARKYRALGEQSHRAGAHRAPRQWLGRGEDRAAARRKGRQPSPHAQAVARGMRPSCTNFIAAPTARRSSPTCATGDDRLGRRRLATPLSLTSDAAPHLH